MRKVDIEEILHQTYFDGERLDRILLSRFDGKMSLEAIVDKIYVTTGGHPRSILDMVKGSDDPPTDIFHEMLQDVKLALNLCPYGIKYLYENRMNPALDLMGIHRKRGETECSFEFLAARIHAGYNGPDSRSTLLWLPPAVEKYLASVIKGFKNKFAECERNIP
jgi:hypothetical protein